jgi:phage shock protein PspC (stress-responsive transcriptional regulator)
MTAITAPKDPALPVSRRASWRRTAARSVRGVAAGLAASLVLGVAARVLMRLGVIVTGGEPGFTWTGSLGVCIAWAAFTLPGALLAALYRGRGRSLGLVAGSLGLAYVATTIARADLEHLEWLGRSQQIGGIAAAAGILLTALAVPWVTLRLMR